MFLRLLPFACALAAAVPAFYPQFRNIAREAGLTASFPNGGAQSKQFIIETTGSGIGFIDYDNDGLLDLFVLSGEGGTNRMYHNEGHDKFRDVTDARGAEVSRMGARRMRGRLR